ncbi:MAG: ParB N-terminal domain-containing protein [Phycisphaerales bacterium]
MVKFSNYCCEQERKVNMERNNGCKQNHTTGKNIKLKKANNWKILPSTTSSRASLPCQDICRPKDDSVQISELECIKYTDLTLYILYSKIVPSLSESDFACLCQDIVEKGVLVPIIVDEHYVIIDGVHRAKGAQLAGLKQIPIQVRPGLTEQEKWKLSQDLNLHRRHLTPAQIQQILKENREILPQKALKLRQEGKSLRQIGNDLGVSHQYVKDLIQKEATVSEITVELPDVIMGKDGKKHPAKKPFIQVNTGKELQRAIDACKKAGADNLPGKSLELKRVERIARESERNQLRQQEMHDYQEGSHKLLLGDFNIRGQELADNSVHMLMTDMPYEQKALPLWEDLAILAKRVLKPSGILISYSGCLYLPQVMSSLERHLTYLWTGAIFHSGAKKKIYPVGLTQGWKPLLIYYKPPLNIYWPTILDIVSGGEEKSDHEWQQSTGEALHFIKAFCHKNGTLLDPCLGSGTSIIAGLQSGLGLKCIGIEVDKSAYSRAKQRIDNYIAGNKDNVA